MPSSLGYDYFYHRNNFLVFWCFEIVFCYQTLWRITETWRRIFQILVLLFMKNTALFSVVHIEFTYWWISVFKFPLEERVVSFRIQVWVMHILAACWTEGNLTSSDNFYCCFQNIYQPKWDFLKTINQGLTQDRLNEYLAGPECRCSYIHTYIYIYIYIYNI